MSSGARRALKRLGERALLAGAADVAGRRFSRGRTLVLAYHGVRPRGEPPAGDAGLHMPEERLEAQLDFLAATHEVIAVADLLAPPRGVARRHGRFSPSTTRTWGRSASACPPPRGTDSRRLSSSRQA